MSSGNATADTIYELLHISPPEWGVIGLGIGVHSVNLMVLAFVNWNRDYLPLKLKQILLVNLSLISGIVWWIGGMATLRILPQANDPVFLACSFWTFWVQIAFGQGSFVVALVLRIVRVYAVLRFNTIITGWKILLWYCGLLSPFVVYCIITSALSVDGPVTNEYGMKVCYMQTLPLYAYFCILLLYLIIILILAILIGVFLKKHGIETRRSHVVKEYEEARTEFIIAFGCYFIYVVLLALGQQFFVWGRCVNTVIVIFIPTFTFYLEIGLPAYKCLVDRDNYANEVMHGQAQANTRSWWNWCGSWQEGKEVVISVSHVSDSELRV